MEIIDRIWLRMPANGGWSYFHCPAAAVDDWIQLGWELSDPPPEPISPVVAENIAAAEATERQESERQAVAEREALIAEREALLAGLPQASPRTTTTEPARRGDVEEGV
jgi:hypothetical protein